MAHVSRRLEYCIILVVVVLFFVCAYAVEFDAQRLWEGRTFMTEYITMMWPPNFSILPKVMSETLLTIQSAFVATVIAAFLSLPFAFLGARNVMRSRFQKIVLNISRFSLDANRSIDALIIALILVSAVGLGPFPGTLALAIHSVGMLGKLFFEAVESIDKGPVEALESAGASRLQVLRWAVLPQVMPYFVSYTLYRFELNIRGAVVLGLVGAGGIGFLLQEYMRLFQRQNVATVLLTILVLVMGIGYLSDWARRRLL